MKDKDVLFFDISKLGKEFPLHSTLTLGEIQCADGSPEILVHPALITGYGIIRYEAAERFPGLKLKIMSAYRTPDHNAKIGGAKESYHTKGMAFDVTVTGVSANDWDRAMGFVFDLACKIFGGVKWYRDMKFIHFDVGPERSW